jgi:Protein of unknown function (DUF3426)
MVRCGKCTHTWPETPPETTSETVGTEGDEAAPDSGPESGAEENTEENAEENTASDPPFDADRDEEEQPDSAGARGNAPGRRAGVPALQRKRKSLVARLAWVLLFLVVIAIIGGGVAFRQQVIDTWPAAKRLYTLVGLTQEPLGVGLDLVNVKFSQQGAGDGALVVEGNVENVSDRVLDVPGLRATLFGKDDVTLQRWEFKAPLPRLLPGESVKFKTVIANPAKGAVRLTIDFYEVRPQ